MERSVGPVSVLWFSLIVLLFPCIHASEKPNIVYILTDDQDIKLGSLEAQPVVQSLLVKQGLFFNNAFVTTPVCCPSSTNYALSEVDIDVDIFSRLPEDKETVLRGRSSILTGKYVHNHHTYENGVDKGCDAPSWRELNENKTIGAYMSMAGYKTGFFGKYLNNYGEKASGVGLDHIPPGWTTWFTLQGNSKYYNYAVSNNGKKEMHGDNYTEDYFTDLIRNHSVDFIHTNAKSAFPFFMYIATPAPHRPATPAPQYANTFAGKMAPRTPSYNFTAMDKHWIISNGTPPMTDAIEGVVDTLYEMRLETLLSVEDLVTAVVNALEDEGVLDNTYIFYNSDHGYHLGQFKQQGEKRQPYDEDIRVPLIVRGPKVPSNMNTSALALNIDLAPTFLDLAGWPLPDDMDGMSLKSVLLGEEEEKEDQVSYQFLVEYFGEGTAPSNCMEGGSEIPFLHDCHNNTFLAVRVFDNNMVDHVYTEFFQTDSPTMDASEIYWSEYYNLTEDFWQVKNQVKMLTVDQVNEFKATLMALHTCSGSACHKLRKK